MINVGVDVHKRICQARLKDRQGTIIEEFRFRNNHEGASRLAMIIKKHGDAKVALKSTGNLWVRLYDRLDEEECVDVILTNPKKTRAIAEAKIKNDKLDARLLADLVTIHKAKGLEFDVVFLTCLRRGSFPRFDVNIEEERRVFYVGLTRARDYLHVICSSPRPSQFVGEIEAARSSTQFSGRRPYQPEERLTSQGSYRPRPRALGRRNRSSERGFSCVSNEERGRELRRLCLIVK
jgi:superfamily I DNA/RNA helicase